MIDWLRNNFEIKKNEEGEEIVFWESDNGLTTKTRIKTIINFLGEQKTEKEGMLEKAPTQGWKKLINRWDELGKFD